ncbi:MAG TPA: zf-HC2 domain-containing protein [Bryobacteraceae bacterium]|nr:zf-HC2 domain-containing protein [Bryobacteraceae bacterium]HOL70771.1 zf-HC2 domain-containing protein [Bryobacteraceae bacterium]HOQ44492.1 zf-HC2 domain-containing protein [Bryobacteraceae bacterium]HPQ16637.1 zf-HC2 domain-containing protein [Bryobacteraceae bacterium]HPU70811.1 zf-HC2 domain-containing protein [Bryobacteraceae bacterium]
MECQVRAREDAAVLMDYCAGRLDPRAAAALDEHVAVCEDCTRWVESQRAMLAALDEWAAPPVSPGFNRRLFEKLEAESRPAWWRLHLRPALSLAGIAALAIGLLLTRAPAPVMQADTLDPDRLELALEDAEMLRQLSIW